MKENNDEIKINIKKIRAYALKNAVSHEGKAKPEPVLNSLFVEGLKKSDIPKVMPLIKMVLEEVNQLSTQEQELKLKELEKEISQREIRDVNELPELEGVDKKNGVIMRFSPSSSAPAFHIGHILTGMPSSLYVKKYGGKFYLRIEDTNPKKTVAECYESFPKEAEWIFGNVTSWYAQSDRMQKYYDFAEKLIKKGIAFVCTCEKKEKNNHEERKPCKCRENSIKLNLELWKKMLDKDGFKEGEAILRFKTPDLNLTNPALIDFPLARINLTEHPRQGKKYRVWPLMNLCVTFDDIEQKCTHIIRAKEHQDNAKRQEMIFDALGVKKPYTYFLGRYKFKDLPISKTQINDFIKKGKFNGWDDIRLPLARNFKRRGYQPEAFARMVKQRGLSNVDKVIKQEDFFQILDSFNRELLIPIAKKVTFERVVEKTRDCIEILMPDNKVIFGKTNLNIKEIRDGDIFYFSGLGFARFNKEEKIKFWFCHR